MVENYGHYYHRLYSIILFIYKNVRVITKHDTRLIKGRKKGTSAPHLSILLANTFEYKNWPSVDVLRL